MPAIQVLMGNILDPALQVDQLDLSPLVILFSLVVWGWIWGIIGMFLAVPLTVGLKIIMAHERPARLCEENVNVGAYIGTGKEKPVSVRRNGVLTGTGVLLVLMQNSSYTQPHCGA